MRKALVIGGSGFFGRHVIRALTGEGLEIYALEHRSPIPAGQDIHIVKGGMRVVTRRWLQQNKPDIIFHTARPTAPLLRKTGRLLAGRYAARLNEKLVREISHSSNQPRLVFASGSLMYGPSPAPADESAPLNPFSFARQYHTGEIPILKAMETGNIPVSVVRLPWLLGNGSWFEWFYLRVMEKYQAIPLFGNGENLMEVIDIGDAARLAVRYAVNPENTGIFNIVSAGPLTQKEFATAVSKLSGLPVVDYREIFPGGIEKEALEAFTCSITLATKHTGILKDFQFTPLQESLKKIMSNYSRHNFK